MLANEIYRELARGLRCRETLDATMANDAQSTQLAGKTAQQSKLTHGRRGQIDVRSLADAGDSGKGPVDGVVGELHRFGAKLRFTDAVEVSQPGVDAGPGDVERNCCREAVDGCKGLDGFLCHA